MTRASEIETAARKVLAHFGAANVFNLFTMGADVDALRAALDAPATDEPPAVVWREASDCPPAIWSEGSAGFSGKLWLKLESKGELYAMRGAAYWSDWDAGLIDWAASREDFTGNFKVVGWAPFLPPAA